ncbi:RAD51-associated protein 2 [Pitangus sulphuratus]|nr:RAD51-associated protein 2 [Pitangus sulphuratus]
MLGLYPVTRFASETNKGFSKQTAASWHLNPDWSLSPGGTVSAKSELIFVKMESTCSKRFLAASSDETEWFPYAKRIKIESAQKTREKEEQQKVEQSIRCGTRYQTSVHGPLYLSERQNHWELEKTSCDTAKKTCVREFFYSKNCSNEGLACEVSENEWSTKKWSPENGDQNITEDDISLNVHGQRVETEPLSVLSAANTCQNLQVLNPPQVEQNNTTEGNNERNGDNGLKQNSSVASSNRHSFQMELLRRKFVSDKKWQQYQLLQIPFVCGTSSVFSHTRNKNNNFLENGCSAEDKNYSSSNKENTTERDNKEKNSSLYIIPTLKPFKSIRPLEIPKFQFSKISNKINGKMSSANSRETDWKNFEGQSSLVQSKQIHGVQKITEIGKQQLQNDKSSARTSIVGSDFKEKNNPLTNKQEHSALAEEVISATYFRGDSTDIEGNKMFAENYFKDEMLENSEGDDDQKSKILIYISAKNVQNEKCVSCNDLLQRMGRKSSNENAGTFHTQTSIPVITEALEKNKLDLHCVVHNLNSDISLYEAESKLSTKEILDCQRYVAKSIIFERNCPHIIVQNFPDKAFVTLPLDSSNFVDTGVSDDGQCRSSSSADELNESETIHAMVQYPSRGSPEITDTNLQLQAKETAQFSLQGHERTNETSSLEPATLKQHPEYVKEQEERNDQQMHVTNESQCDTVMNDLIMSHSEDESQTFIAAEEELKMHLPIMNNGCLEDVNDKHLPLENKITHEFELKTKFDLVLEELRMFHEISKGNENNLSSLETNSHENYWELNNSEGIDGNVTSVSQKKISISSPICGTIEKQNITDSTRSLLNEKILNENKDQEVPKEYCISKLSSEELLDSPVAEGKHMELLAIMLIREFKF